MTWCCLVSSVILHALTFGKLISGKPEAAHRSPRCFDKNPWQGRNTPLSSEWLNNSRKSRVLQLFLGPLFFGDMTHGCDTIKTLLWIRLCTQKRMEGSGSAWQMVSLNGGPKHLRAAAKSFSKWGWVVSWKNFGQSSEVIFPFWGGAYLTNGSVTRISKLHSHLFLRIFLSSSACQMQFETLAWWKKG